MHVVVLGAGTMGRDIGHVCAVGGHEVTVRDVDPAVLADARAHVESNFAGGVERGELGRKTGEGFYVREDGEAVRTAGERR